MPRFSVDVELAERFRRRLHGMMWLWDTDRCGARGFSEVWVGLLGCFRYAVQMDV
jgi:hypothetical protein